MTSLCQWIWGSSVCWWWTGKPGVLQSTVLQRVRHDGTTGLNWTWEWHRRVSGLTRVFLAIEQPLSLPCTVSSRTNSLSYYLQKPTHRKCHGSLRWGFTWDTSCNFLKQGRKRNKEEKKSPLDTHHVLTSLWCSRKSSLILPHPPLVCNCLLALGFTIFPFRSWFCFPVEKENIALMKSE